MHTLLNHLNISFCVIEKLPSPVCSRESKGILGIAYNELQVIWNKFIGSLLNLFFALLQNTPKIISLMHWSVKSV